MSETLTAEIVDEVPHRQWHRVVLVAAAAVVGAAAMLEVRGQERVAIRGLPNYPLPHTCTSRTLLGISCPGCGLTRSFVYLAHGQWREAWHVHRLGWLLAGLVVVQFPYRAMILAGLARPIPSRTAKWLSFCLAGLLLANWTLGLVSGFF